MKWPLGNCAWFEQGFGSICSVNVHACTKERSCVQGEVNKIDKGIEN